MGKMISHKKFFLFFLHQTALLKMFYSRRNEKKKTTKFYTIYRFYSTTAMMYIVRSFNIFVPWFGFNSLFQGKILWSCNNSNVINENIKKCLHFVYNTLVVCRKLIAFHYIFVCNCAHTFNVFKIDGTFLGLSMLTR